jgi:thioredoxin 1
MKDTPATAARTGMGAGAKVAIVVALAAAVGGVVWLKNRDGAQTPPPPPPPPVNGTQGGQPVAALPRLVDLGADKCIPCKLMAPILEELKKEYAGKLEVAFIDVWKNPDAGKKYGINMIPTQIFYGANGRELFRHEGFFSREDILKKWKELGVEFAPAGPPATGG